MPLIITSLIVLVPFLLLVLAVINTLRANARSGGQPFEFTYRAYSA